MKIQYYPQFYMRNMSELSFIQRLSYVALNKYCIDFNRFKFSVNPLKWCILDIIKLVWLPLLCVLWAMLVPTVMTYSAIKIKDKYLSIDWIGVYAKDVHILTFDKK